MTTLEKSTAPDVRTFTYCDAEFQLGTVSAGTLRSQDLAPVFAGILRRMLEADGMHRSLVVLLDDLEAEHKHGWGDVEVDDVDWLQDEINALLYDLDVVLCSSPGDGADFGFWTFDDWD